MKNIYTFVVLAAGCVLFAMPASAMFATSGLDSNQVATIGPINIRGGNGPGAPALGVALGNQGANAPFQNALNQLSPEKFGVFTSVLAFNNASFETLAMDSYLASLRTGPGGSFAMGNQSFDASGITVNGPGVDAGLAQIYSRMLAWSPGALPGGLLSDTPPVVLGGTDMKDSKDMKSMAAPVSDNPWNVFVRGNVVLAQGFSQQDLPHLDYTSSGVVVGADYRLGPHFLVGATASYEHTSAALDEVGSTSDVDSYSPGLFAAYADSGWYANFVGSYLRNSYEQSRVITFLGQKANSSTNGNEGVANLDGGYDFHTGALDYGPLAGLQYVRLGVQDYDENGSLADLSVQNQNADSLRSRLGGHLCYTFVEGDIKIKPYLQAAWQHEFMDQSRGITSSFDTVGGGNFSVQTPVPSRDSALVDIGVSADINRTVSVFTDYLVEAGQDNYFGQSVQAGVKIGF